MTPRACLRCALVVLGLFPVLAAPAAAASRAPGAWPTLPQQLAEARARPGSRLDRMIRDNQQFWLLSSAELDGSAGSATDLPPWLRVAWRKAHPDFDPAGTSASYPLVLRDLYEMLEEPSGGESEAKGGPRKVTDYGDRAMSSLPTSVLRESDVKIDPFSPNRIIAASNDPTTKKQAMFRSADSGLSWKQSALPFANGDQGHSDPTVDWTSDGTAWSTTLGFNFDAMTVKGRVYKSADGGKTWTFDSTFSGSQDQVDKQMVVIDHNPTSARKDWTYAVWHVDDKIFFNRRPDGGSWGAPQQISGAESSDTVTGADVEVNGDGFVYAFWTSKGNRKIFLRFSLDGGSSFEAPVEIASTFGKVDVSVPAIANRRALIYVSAATFRSVSKAMVYAAWTDLSGNAGCTSPGNEPKTDPTSPCTSRIWFARSADFGQTWEAPVRINNPAEKNDQFHPALAVDPTTGILSVTYHDTTGDGGRTKTNVWYQASYDDGVTWTAPVEISSAPTDESVFGAGTNQYGDYNGLSAFGRILSPSWTDRRDGKAEAIWTSVLEEPRPDVWMADKPWDTGLEPDPATELDHMWESEDIWVRNDPTPGTHQNPIFGQTNYVHVTVRNRGQASAENLPLKLYWAKSSAGLGWPGDWSEIATEVIPKLGGNQTTEVVIPWDPPGSGHYCLYARLDTTQDGMHASEGWDVWLNTRLNNNIAWKNVVVVSLLKFPKAAIDLVIHNSMAQAASMHIGFADPLDRGVERPFLKRGRLTLGVDPELVRRWREGGALGRGIRLLDDRTFEIVEGGAELIVRLEAGDAFKSEIDFEDLERSGSERAERHVIVVTESNGEREPLGGVTYQIEAPVR
ncbi:MAG TPA: hypothetical protein VN783_17600 [Thermoanaerobaculia bacterium]|nr:hypothetical protein [Thermoanaerobaculia bacterium]